MTHIATLFNFIKNNSWSEFIEYLKDNEDIDVNIRDTSNNYLINYAIVMNNIEATSLLIHRGSKLDITDQDGRSLLFLPIKLGFVELLRLLLHFNKTNIGLSLVDMRDKNGHIPLHYAINFKNLEIVKMLLDADSNVNYVDNNKNNSLHHAVYSKHLEIVKLVVNKGVDIHAKTDTGENSLHIACNFQLNDISKFLIDKGIDVNSQDSEHEFTPMHYAINLNNKDITTYLLERDANPNMQDFLGNTPLHYTIIEDNIELYVIMITSDFIKTALNYNIYNYENKMPIHLILEKDNMGESFQSNIDILISGSNLNFQDVYGYTGLHYLSMDNLWIRFKQILEKKKLDIFIPNIDGKRPIDYIGNSYVQEYLDMITKSYLYVLKNYNKTNLWNEQWENICSKASLSKEEVAELKSLYKTNKVDDTICENIIKEKLNKLYKIGLSCESCKRTELYKSCTNKSFPVKKNKKCVDITEGNRVEVCTFTGITFDILIGLLYLLSKYKHTCSTLDTEFIENKDLCAYYKSVGIMSKTKCEFLNFEIIWIHHKLYMSTNFINNFKKCSNNSNKKYIIIPLGIELKIGNHANYLIYDKSSNEIERFEPYGSQAPYNFDYNPTLLDKILEKQFTDINKNIKYVSPRDYMPKIGFQFLDSLESYTKKIGDPLGFCALWTIWYTDMRLKYHYVDRKSLVKKIIKGIKLQQLSYKNIIRNYSKDIINIRDDIFSKAGLTINDWLNDQYTDKQMDIVIAEVTKFIKQYS